MMGECAGGKGDVLLIDQAELLERGEGVDEGVSLAKNEVRAAGRSSLEVRNKIKLTRQFRLITTSTSRS